MKVYSRTYDRLSQNAPYICLQIGFDDLCFRDWQTIVQEEHRSRQSLLGAEVNKDCDCDGQEGVSSVSDCLKADGAQESLLCESSSVSRGHSTINGGFDSGKLKE